MTTLLILGLAIPTAYIIWLFGYSIKKCSNGEGEKPLPLCHTILLLISIFVLGFTAGIIKSIAK